MGKWGYSDLLFSFDDESLASVVGYAAALAKDFDAELTCLHVAPDQLLTSLSTEIQFSAQLYATQRHLEQHKSTHLKNLFFDRVKPFDIKSHWRQFLGDTREHVEFEARYADLILMGTCAIAKRPHCVQDQGLAKFFLSTQRPLLIVPADFPYAESLTHILIAWNGTREAMHAVIEAIPLLKKAKKVSVAIIQHRKISLGPFELPTWMSGYDPGNRLRHYLERRNINAEIHLIHEAQKSIAKTLVEVATQHQASLIVAGAFGHSLVREKLLGSTTLDLLELSPVPLLLAQ